MKKSTFRKIYDKLPAQKVVAPKTEWIKRMAEICKVHPTTVRCWLAGTQKPVKPVDIGDIDEVFSIFKR